MLGKKAQREIIEAGDLPLPNMPGCCAEIDSEPKGNFRINKPKENKK